MFQPILYSHQDILTPQSDIVSSGVVSSIRLGKLIVQKYSILLYHWSVTIPRFVILLYHWSVTIPRFVILFYHWSVIIPRFVILFYHWAVIIPRRDISSRMCNKMASWYLSR